MLSKLIPSHENKLDFYHTSPVKERPSKPEEQLYAAIHDTVDTKDTTINPGITSSNLIEQVLRERERDDHLFPWNCRVIKSVFEML